MVAKSKKKYDLEVEKAINDFMIKSSENRSFEKAMQLLDATQIFIMAQKALYGENPDWDGMTLNQKMPFGWFRPQFIMVETMVNGRWKYWIDFRAHCNFGSGEEWIDGKPIPEINFLSVGQNNNLAKEMIRICLEEVPGAQQYSSDQRLEMFIDWLLFGFGCKEVKDLPNNITDEMRDFWYREFKPQLVLMFPYDYLGDIAANNKVGKNTSYFPTPLNIVECMTRMSMEKNEATKYKTVCDPCLGSGGMLLSASNYSLRLYGQEINKLIYKISLVNSYFYMPWAVETDDKSNAVLDNMAKKYEVKENEEVTGS